MKQRLRPIIAILGATTMLLVQALPAFAVCACDLPNGVVCCDAPEVEVQPAGCCASKSVERAGSCCSAGNTSDGERISTPKHRCQRAVLEHDLDAATMPVDVTPAQTQTTQLSTLVVVTDNASLDVATTTAHADAPRARSAPIFLLTTALLI